MDTFQDFLNVHSVVSFKPLVGRCGQCQKANHHISIDLTSYISPAKIFLHELIHLLHKDWKESQVLWWEHYWWGRLSHDEVEQLYRKMYRDNARCL